MRVAAFLLVALLAFPAGAADWMRVEMIFETEPDAAPGVVRVLKERLRDHRGGAEIDAHGGSLRVTVLLEADEDAEAFAVAIAMPGLLGMHRVVGEAPACAEAQPDLLCLPQSEPDAPFLLLRAAELDNSAVADAIVDLERDHGLPVVGIRLTSDGAERFGRMTSELVGERIAIVIDGTVVMAPVVRMAIPGGSLVIDGSFTVRQATDLARQLRSPRAQGSIRLVSLVTAEADPPGWGTRLRRLFE